MAVLPTQVDQVDHAASDGSAGLIDLCEVFARPSLYLDPELVQPYLAVIGIDLTEDDPELPPEWVDEVFFDHLMARLSALPEADWTLALNLSHANSVVPLIATAPSHVITQFAIAAAAACLQEPIGQNVLKRNILHISEILGPEASKIAFGEAQFLYQGLGTLGDASNIYHSIFRLDAEHADAHAGLVNFGQSIIYATLTSESRLWAEIFSFRTGPAGFQPAFELKNFSAQQKNLILRLWKRKWKKWQNS